jgi:hypothetical protein
VSSQPPVKPLSSEAVEFRRLVIDALWPPNDSRCHYGNEAVFSGVCPLCDLTVVVRFAGLAARATLICWGGCSEAAIAAEIGMRYTT